MKYTEKDYTFSYEGMKGWLQNLVALIIVAPLRLINEITTKLMFLQKSLIQKILNLAACLSVICVVLYCILESATNGFDLWTGKVPLVLQITCALMLIILAIWFKFYDFDMYRQIDKFLSITKEDTNNIDKFSDDNQLDVEPLEPTNNKTFNSFEDEIFSELNALDLPEVEPVSSSLDIEQLTQKLNEHSNRRIDPSAVFMDSESINESINEMQHEALAVTQIEEPQNVISFAEEDFYNIDNLSSSVGSSVMNASNDLQDNTVQDNTVQQTIKNKDLDNLDDDLLEILNQDLLTDETTINYQNRINAQLDTLEMVSDEELSKKMDDSTDPSKYITEENLFRFLNELRANEFDMFDDYKVPGDYDLLT